MKSLYITSILFLFATFSAKAQKFSVSGRVLKKDNRPLSFSSVQLNKDSVKIAEVLADQLGAYKFANLGPGSYLLVASFLGERITQRVQLSDSSRTVNFILPEEEVKSLKTVNITSNKALVERKLDRLVFNVESSIAALGGDASDVLKLTPGVTVSNDEIAMIGKGSVNILINDRIVPMTGPELMSYLKSIPADRIQKIEVITNPPAKYDAAGNSGLINIQLKSVPKEDSWSAAVSSAGEFATFPTVSQGANFTYKKNRLSLLTGLTYRFGDKIYRNDIHYVYPNDELLHNELYGKSNRKTIGSLANLQYELSPKSSLGVQYSGSFSKGLTAENTLSRNYSSQVLTKDYYTDGTTSARPKVNGLNLNYNHKIDSAGKKYSADFDYFSSLSPRNNLFNSNQQDIVNQASSLIFAANSSSQKIQNFSVKTDVELPYPWAAVTFGAKVSSTKTINFVSASFADNPLLTDPYQHQDDHFEYTEKVAAVYASADKKLGDKWSAKVGLRGELTHTQADSYSTSQFNRNHYFKLFPTVYVLYKLNKSNSLDVNFGRRIGRPGFWELNPARWYMNPQSYTEGNPFLQPSFSYDFELNYSYKSMVNAGVYYSRVENGFSQVTFHDVATETQIFQRLNYYNSNDAGAFAIFSIKPVKFWDARLSASAYHKQSYNFIPLFNRDFSGWGGYTRTMNVFTLNSKNTLLLNVDYNYTYAGRNRETAYTQYSSCNLGLKGLLCKKKLIIGLNFEDIFKNNYSTFQSVSGDVQQSFTQYYDTRLTRISLSYSFGNSKIGMSKRNVGNQEERNRTN